jgi:hypothetical protein
METIVGFIPKITKHKFLGFVQTSYSIVVTDVRTIFAKLDTKLLKESIKVAQKEAKAEGVGFFSKIKMQMEAMETYPEKYMSMSAEEILAETPDNFYVYHDHVKSIKVKHVFQETQHDDSYQATDQTTIKYKTVDKTLKFKARDDRRKSFKDLYENRVKIK